MAESELLLGAETTAPSHQAAPVVRLVAFDGSGNEPKGVPASLAVVGESPSIPTPAPAKSKKARRKTKYKTINVPPADFADLVSLAKPLGLRAAGLVRKWTHDALQAQKEKDQTPA